MAQDTITILVASLNQATTSEALTDILRQIKNSLVGHVQRKELAVTSGVIVPLVQIVAGDHQIQTQLEATIILSNLAAGGLQFVSPLLAARVDTQLLHNLAHQHTSLVKARLQALRNLASSWSLDTTQELQIINPDSIELFNSILQQSDSVQVQLVCELLVSTAEHNDTKTLLGDSEIIDTLTALLVSYTVSTLHKRYQGDASQLPKAPAADTVPKVLAAICSIIIGSCYRTCRFVYSPRIRDLCMSFNGEDDIRLMFNRTPQEASLLPTLQTPPPKSVRFQASNSAYGQDQQIADAIHINTVIAWLLVFARKLAGADRLVALRLVAVVAGGIDDAAAMISTNPNPQKTCERERQLTLLAVPLAARLVQDALDSQAQDRHVQENACQVLAELIKPSKDLQIAAVDAGAIKSVCSSLRKSFNSIVAAKPQWSPRTNLQGNGPTNTLGDPGLPSEVLHVMKRRLGALNALAALADKEEAHRKAIVDANVSSCMIEALKPLSLSAGTARIPRRVVEGNTIEVVIAACHAAQNMSRSVAILRTSLMDAGIAKPTIELLHHPQVEVQVAATDVCANLVIDFSPMREPLVDLGLTQVLCEQVKDGTPALQLSSLWAVKHLLIKADDKLRTQIIEHLGVRWLLRLIEGVQTYGAVHGGGVALSSANAAGEQIDLLNPAGMDVDEPEEDGELLYDESSNTHYQASSMRSTLHTSSFDAHKQLANIKNAEHNTALQAKRDDIAIQEQALDLLRNFITGKDCVPLLNYLFSKIRPQELLDVILSKLIATRTMHRPVFNSIGLVLGALALLTHVSNGNAQHKEEIVNRRDVLDAVLPHCSHPDPQVRVMCMWVIAGVAWIEDVHNDQVAARWRITELKRAGFEHAVRRMTNDPDLDVRERARVCLRALDGA